MPQKFEQIWKFPFTKETAVDGDLSSHVVDMPWRAKILAGQFQDGTLCLWARVDPTAKTVRRTFHVVGTGRPYCFDSLHYIATVQKDIFVFHVFEEIYEFEERTS